MGSHSHGDEFNIRMNVVGFREMLCEPDSESRPTIVSTLHSLDDRGQVI